MTPNLLLVAHGTRVSAGIAEINRLSTQVSARLPHTAVGVAYVDVLEPTVTQALDTLPGPTVVVPLFLAAGYHVRHDIPASIAESGRDDVVVASPVGSDECLPAVLSERLRAAGWDPADRVVLAAAGSSDRRARDDVGTVRDRLTGHIGQHAQIGYVATADPRVPAVVARLRAADPARRVAIASYLLAPGSFQHALLDAGADIVTEPIGAHPTLVDAAVCRYHSAAHGRVTIAIGSARPTASATFERGPRS